MIGRCFALVLLVVTTSPVRAEVEPVVVRIPEPQGWTGQRIRMLVDLRAPGSFDGSASFSLPQIPRTVVVRIGSPVVSSETIDGESWFVQTHEFAVFSQQTGAVRIPRFPVRFRHLKGFVGPSFDREEMVPAAEFEIRRPPDTERYGFLVTTNSIEISESWSIEPGGVQAGTVVKRIISQSAQQMTGMALAPPPTAAPEGVRMYPVKSEVQDRTERGEFTGIRQDELTYLLRRPGSCTLPAITYVWWNPQSQELRSTTLPAVEFEVTTILATDSGSNAAATVESRRWSAAWLMIPALVVGFAVWQRAWIRRQLVRIGNVLFPPERTAARRLLRACRTQDLQQAEAAWNAWLALQTLNDSPTPELAACVVDLRSRRFGNSPMKQWDSARFEQAFRSQRQVLRKSQATDAASYLPRLNPTSSGR